MRLIKIGRDSSCNIVLHSDKVSSLHAELTLLNNGDILLEDKGSRNGTFVMNQQIKPNKPVNVRRGDKISFADVELQWSQIPMPEDNSAYKGLYGVGSHFNNDFQISGATVSRYHATIKQGRDGKMYIVDHSKNGTTVDGIKIQPNTPYRIKRKSNVVCGGVPVDLSRLPWPTEIWKYIGGIAASVLVIAGIAAAIWMIPQRNKEWNSSEIFDRYSTSVVLITGVYHYEVKAGSLDLAKLGLPTKFLFINGKPQNVSNLPQEVIYKYGAYNGTGFFISDDGQIVTNLHVVKPWLFNNSIKEFEEWYRLQFAKIAEERGAALTFMGIGPEGLSAYISQIKVEGVSDGVFIVPHGRYYSSENAINCTIISAGDDTEKDVALIQSEKMELPNKRCTYVNVVDSMDVSENALKVGTKMFTIGFPHGNLLQNLKSEKGIQVSCHAGDITRDSGEFDFQFDAVSAGGASGSPIFNDHGMLIGVLNAGVDKENINLGIKAKYVKELLEAPHQK